jgi:predicted phosphodiesterase
MICLTGDTHIPIDIGKLGTKNFPQQKNLTKADFVLVLGDFGLIWNREQDAEESFWTKWLDDKTFITLWLAGNHENHDRLDAMPVTEFLGGKVHKISDSIYHLIDNQIFEIDGKKFYVLGGAQSTDKIYRREGISWWPQELPNFQKCNEVVDFITKHGEEVDYVVTHCFPTFYQRMVSVHDKQNCLTDLLTVVDEKTPNKKGWYCGHYHLDKQVDKLHRVLYNDIVEVGE